jgi:hypothetical protein
MRKNSLPSHEFSEDECGAVVETDIPARLDALPWSRFHTLVVVALGITWILDGLEVTLTDVPVPDAPFPRMNSTEQFWKVVRGEPD